MFVVHTSLWKIHDGLVKIKKIIADSVEQWNNRLCDILRKSDKKKEKSQLESESPRTPDIESEFFLVQSSESANSASPVISKKIKSLDQSDGIQVCIFLCRFIITCYCR